MLPSYLKFPATAIAIASVAMLLASMTLSWLEGLGPDASPFSMPKYLAADAILLWVLAIVFHDRIFPRPQVGGHDLWLVVPFAISLVLFYAYTLLVWARSAAPKNIVIALTFGGLLMLAMVFYQEAARRPALTVSIALLRMAIATSWLALDPPPREKLGRVMVLFAQTFAGQAVIGFILQLPFLSLMACVLGAPCAVSGFVRSRDFKNRSMAVAAFIVMGLWVTGWLLMWSFRRFPAI